MWCYVEHFDIGGAGNQVHHKNFNRQRNCATNLVWSTHADNVKQSALAGRMGRKLDFESAKRIRAAYKTGLHSHRSLARDFGVSHVTIRHVVNQRIWRTKDMYG